MTPSPPLGLDAAVRRRYAELAESGGSLACGGALALAAAGEGEVLVDLGCGQGRDVIAAARRVGPTGKAIGVDRTPAMVRKAFASVPAGLGNVAFVCCDFAALDMKTDSTDVVISNCAINHAPDKLAVFREIHRILKPSGRFVVSDIVAEQALPDTVRRDPEAWAACYGGAIPADEYLAAIASAGFDPVEVLDRTQPYEKGGVTIRSVTIRGYKPAAAPALRPGVEEGEE